jgi:Antitoxin VbhA
MTKSQILRRKRNVNSAIGSSRAEGLVVPATTKSNLNKYASGKITLTALRKLTLSEVKAKQK